jgi:catechol 2,3-dioxygenase-like lactoylglutathione lyase family enzyme
MPLSRTVPALPVRDLSVSSRFYVDRLGFEILHLDDGIAVLRRDDAVINLWASADERWRTRPGFADNPVRSGAESFLAGTASCRLEVGVPAEVDVLYAEMAAAAVLHPIDDGSPTDTEWGTREFAVLDDVGNLLSFYAWHRAPGTP